MKIEQKTVFFIEHNDFERFVDDKFGFEHPYECAEELESSKMEMLKNIKWIMFKIIMHLE